LELPSTDDRILTEDLFTAFRHFMGGRIHGLQLTPQRFGRLLASQPLSAFNATMKPHKGGKGVRCWTGIKLQSDCKWEEGSPETGRYIVRDGEEENDHISRDF
jgi:hypothetical protein